MQETMPENKVIQREVVKLNSWIEEIKTQQESGLTVLDWCKKHGKTRQGYYYRKRRVLAVLESMRIPQDTPSPPVEFAALPNVVSKPETRQNPEPMLHIRQDNLEIDIPATSSPETIKAVIGALKC